ncbi:MAG: SAM-dependent methyltransferase [Gammaproteobacteria bacterium]|nr:SAM-dependent methyltransferase [Gammaproteobacteria bacterium]
MQKPVDNNQKRDADPVALGRSEQLTTLIRARLEQVGGAIPFPEFMALCLYQPELGYYCAAGRKFGVGGDFVTAPEISPLFGQMLGRQCAEMVGQEQLDSLLEVGAGSGLLCLQLLLELERQQTLPAEYLILDLSPDLRARQQQLIRQQAPQLAERVRWIDKLPTAYQGIVVANELLDALPCERIRVQGQQIESAWVSWNGNRFVESWRACESEQICDRLQPLLEQRPPLYITEINLQAEAWTRTLAAELTRGVMLLFDYGHPRNEFYHPQRTNGTLRCHYQHRASDDALIRVGLQDITAHVDFTAIAEAAVETGLEPLGFTTQSHFLINCGVTERLAETPADAPDYLNLVTRSKQLLLPGGMGESIKVIAFGRGIDQPLTGFAQGDLSHRL